MTLTDAEHLAVLLAVAMFLAMVGGAAFLAVRVRKRWRSRRGLFSAVLPRRLANIPLPRVSDSVANTVGSTHWWVVQRDRHAMWRSVAAARRAVSIAARADAPVGELPLLTRQLQQAASGVDAALRASGGEHRLSRAVRADRLRIEAAAADIRAAAFASLEATRQGVQPVVSAIAVEITALAAGIQSVRSMATPTH